jgi:hypothetical protein
MTRSGKMTVETAADAREWRVRRSERMGGCYDVVAPDGAIWGTYPSAAQASAICGTRMATEARKARLVTRPCLCCGASFESEGAHNRMCTLCRRKGSDLDPQRPYLPKRRSA